MSRGVEYGKVPSRWRMKVAQRLRALASHIDRGFMWRDLDALERSNATLTRELRAAWSTLTEVQKDLDGLREAVRKTWSVAIKAPVEHPKPPTSGVGGGSAFPNAAKLGTIAPNSVKLGTFAPNAVKLGTFAVAKGQGTDVTPAKAVPGGEP